VAALERAQRDYVAAHAKVQAAEGRLAAAQVHLGELDVDLDAAIDAVARTLVLDGKLRANPFTGLSSRSPSALTALPVADKAAEVHLLVTAVRHIKGVSKLAIAAAQAADKAAQAVERGVTDIQARQADIRAARHTRDVCAQIWAAAVGALKRGARAASDDGAAGLYAALFERAPGSPLSPTKRSPRPKRPPITPPPAANGGQPTPSPAA